MTNAVLDFPASGMLVFSRVLKAEQQLRTRHFILVLVLVLVCSPCGERAFAAKRAEKPSKPPAAREMICQLQSPCRPVREGCHLERIGQYNEEVCKQGGGRTP